ncbi:T9SS type A sorting domain-containing protein [Fulvivirga sedimenti]|uniref:T9SS type A sorting domain-containing protein n=1 Tax=Fulvivirga sedimenti TaxID=2879465 RepID=A0A9X1L382_9BACT|nr:T9SS type A sorting domain-containing protein [Fulvivirga sedimenti]MCA6079006.1 T9SS type A sorting domain-containing protein [Fulvivirga sedimenti]
MKLRYFILVLSVLVACNAENDSQRPLPNRITAEDAKAFNLPSIKNETGSEDNPADRFEFDLLRFRDPVTGRIPENIREKELAFAARLPVSKGFVVRDKNGIARNIQANFTSAGPSNVGGRSRAVAIDITNENVILAGGVSGGLWRSTNLGNTWTRITPVTELPNIRSITQDTRPGKENIWYYGTGEILPGSSASTVGAPYRGNGIYKSTDGGITWNRIPSTATDPINDLSSPFNYVHDIVTDRSNTTQDEVYAAALGGIYRSTNGFSSVQLVLGHSNIVSNNDAIWTEVAVTSTGIVYATLSNSSGNKTAPSGIFRSETGLAGSWVEITPPSGFGTDFRRTVIGIDPSNENIVYFLGNKGDNNSLHRYDDSAPDGSEWTDLTSSLPKFGGIVGDYNAQSSYNMLIKVHPANSNIVYIGGTNLYRSRNAFADDTQIDWVGGYSRNNNANQYFNHHADQHTLAFFPSNPNRMISGHDGGLSITNNNLKNTETEIRNENNQVVQRTLIDWENLNNGYVTTQFYSLAFEEENVGDPSIMGGMQDNSTFILQDPARTSDWINIGAGDGGFCYYDNQSVIFTAQYANVFRIGFVNNAPQSFNISPPNGGDQEFNLFVNPILADPVAPNKVFVGGKGRIYYTLDVRDNPRDEKWFSFGTPTIPSNEKVSAMAASESPQSIMYIGTERGRLFRVDNSTSLNQINDVTGSGFPNNGYITSIAVDPANANRVVVAFSNYNVTNLFYSTNGGTSWDAVSGNLSNAGLSGGGAPSVRWVTMMPNGGNGNIYLLGTSVGLISTTQLSGSSTVWEREAVNTIGTVPIDMVRVRPIDGYIGVATHGNGIYEARINVPLQARLQLLDILCREGTAILQTNIQFQGVENEFDLQYEWFFNGQSLGDGLNGPGISTTTEGRYQVRITNAVNGQSDLSNEIILDFGEANPQWCSGNPVASAGEDISSGLRVFPNPAERQLSVEHPFIGEVMVRIVDMNGRMMYEERSSQSQLRFDISLFPAGTYILLMTHQNEIISRKFIKK